MGVLELPKGTPNGPFASAAMDLAEAGLAVIPCGSDDGKVPSIKWRNMRYRPGAEFIGKLAKQHGHANVGILTGKLSGVLIVDIDTPEIVDAMLERFGQTPLKTRTPSGGVHLWYRWNGEKSGSLRNQGLAVDIKGAGGFVVVPPSVRPSTGSPYTWLKGSLKDLSSLPRARPGSLPLTNERAVPEPLRAITEGRRNNTLFKLLLREVHRCDSRLALQDVAQTINDDCDPPLSDMELARLVDSVWSYETTGRNWAGKEAMIVFTASEFSILMDNPNALTLRGVLQVMHGARPEPFAIVAKAMAETGVIPGWGWRRYRSATNWLVNKGSLTVLHEGGKFPGDEWLFTLSSPPQAKGTPSGPNIIIHPSPVSVVRWDKHQKHTDFSSKDAVVEISATVEDPFEFGTMVREARKAKGWSQERAADAVGISRPGLGNIETGRYPAGPSLRTKLAAVLDLAP